MKERINQGFHRVGLVLGVVFFISGAVQVANKYQPSMTDYLLPVFIGGGAYILFKSLAWVITGFMKD